MDSSHGSLDADCQELTKLLNGSTLNFGIHNWLREIRYWQSKFEGIQFQWVERTHNNAADQLSKFKMPRNISFVYHHYVPHVLTNILHEDFCNSSLS
ncbi:unnamed protein product [Arabidopsis halleri]